MSAPPTLTLRRGDPCPWITQRSAALPGFAVDSMAGRYIVLCFYGSAIVPAARSALNALRRHRAFFDDQRACFFGVSVDPQDEAQGRVKDLMPGIRFLWDFDTSASRECGALASVPVQSGQSSQYHQFWLVVDPTLHVLAVFPFGSEIDHEAVFKFLLSLPAPERFAGFEIPAPVLVLPNVFDQDLCQRLIRLYDETGGAPSGFHREGAGLHDHSFKRRNDCSIEDPDLIQHLQSLVRRRIVPEIEKLFFMKITRMERHIIGCYSAEDGGHFRPHRDNGPGLTAHRRFACSINLSGDFDGGEVSFPEYNARGIKAPPGWCVVFPCAILHMVSRVTRGRRYAFLPFVYDEEGAKIRQHEIAKLRQQAPDSLAAST